MIDTSALPAKLDEWILDRRSSKNVIDPRRPYAWFTEEERTQQGRIEAVATLLLSNRECPFRCLMCDLWKNTLDEKVPDGAIAEQIDWTLRQCSPVRHVKLYNAGNFFDAQAIPSVDLPLIAQRLENLETVVIECHPKLIGRRCLEWSHQLRPKLQVAMGLETVHPQVLAALNKQMNLDDFARAAALLHANEIDTRAFLLVKPPFLSEEEGVRWSQRSLDFAAECGVECCVLIPTRAGNGAMEALQASGHFSPPQLESLETAFEYGLRRQAGRVFTDLWDIERLWDCAACGPQRTERLRKMNLSQQVLPRITCPECGT